MLFRAVNGRCAIDLNQMQAENPQKDVLGILDRKGFKTVEVDLVNLGRGLVDRARFCYSAKLAQAPAEFDCSSFTKWLYSQKGIWIPRLSIQQSECGEVVADIAELEPGDLVFTTGLRRVQRYLVDPAQGIGHVSLVGATKDSVISATDSELGCGVVEITLEKLFKTRTLRAIRRPIPISAHIVTLLLPPDMEVETSDDIKWLIRSNKW